MMNMQVPFLVALFTLILKIIAKEKPMLPLALTEFVPVFYSPGTWFISC
jgi:hypothetical protein